MTFTPNQPSPLARTISPFKDPRPAPSVPGRTAQLWDEYEKRAVENAKRRERTAHTTQPQRKSTSSITPTKPPSMTSARSSFDFKFRTRQTAASSNAVATCKTCQQPITLASGICEPCKKTIILQSPSAGTPPLSPTARNFGSADLQLLHAKLSQEIEKNVPKSTSQKRKSFCPIPTQFVDPPVRLSSLHPPSTQSPVADATSGRKTSLTDPNEPFLRLKCSQTTYTNTSHPSTPTYPPTTPPSTSHSRSSTRPTSLANPTSPANPAVHIPTHPYSPRQHSITPSELSAVYACASPSTLNRPSISTNATAYTLQHATSAWDNWDSDSEGEKAGLVGYLKKAGKSKKKERERADSKTSMDSVEVRLSCAREEERKKSRDCGSAGGSNREPGEGRKTKGHERTKSRKKRPSGFVRAISCGGCSDD